jgi:hypothetical protein
MGQLIVYACRLSSENRRDKERKRLHVVAEITVDARPRMGLSGGISMSRGLAAHLRPYCAFEACAAATS